MDLCEFKTGLVYRVSLRPARATLRQCQKAKKKKKRVPLLDIIEFVSLLGQQAKWGMKPAGKR